jgi:hypothetical protein
MCGLGVIWRTVQFCFHSSQISAREEGDKVGHDATGLQKVSPQDAKVVHGF